MLYRRKNLCSTYTIDTIYYLIGETKNGSYFCKVTNIGGFWFTNDYYINKCWKKHE